jgi:hypothetical protein
MKRGTPTRGDPADAEGRKPSGTEEEEEEDGKGS